MKLSEFISKYEGNLGRLTDNINSGNLKTIEGSLERAKQIDQQLNVFRYRLVFIGKPGGGKTTNICNYLNLTSNPEVGGQFDCWELFETASGRTTAAEIHIQRSDRTALLIYPMEVAQQQGLIKDYCSYIWSLAFAIENDDEEGAQDASQEYERIIRNMLDFIDDNEFIDYVQENFSAEEFAEFLDDTLGKVKITATPTELVYPGTGDIKDWLQKTFKAVNKGKNRICIPERIDVLLNCADIDYCMPDFISEVIDTRGYDGNAREDLREYLSADDTICMILDEVNSLPNEIQRKILTEWVDKDQNDMINRISLMVNVRGEALAEVNEADGDAEAGKKIKLRELKRIISSRSLNYRLENTIFVDPYEGIELKRVKSRKHLMAYDPDAREEQRKKITEHFRAMIQHHREALTEEADKLMKNIEQTYELISTPSKTRVFSEKLKEISAKITMLKEVMCGDIQTAFDDCEDTFLRYFRKTIHWRSAQKTVYMEGNWYKANIYYAYTEFCEKRIKEKCYPRKIDIIKYIELLKECEAPSEDIDAFINTCITNVTLRYDNTISTAWDRVRKLCQESLPEYFWSEAQNVQRGTGYYDRLIQKLNRQMIRSDLSEQTAEIVKDEINTFIGEIILALKDRQEAL